MSKNQSFNGRVYETLLEVAPGAPLIFKFATTAPATVVVHALGAGVSASVSVSASPSELVDMGTARFVPVRSMGTNGVIANASDFAEVVTPLTAVRVEATGGPVIVEVLQ